MNFRPRYIVVFSIPIYSELDIQQADDTVSTTVKTACQLANEKLSTENAVNQLVLFAYGIVHLSNCF